MTKNLLGRETSPYLLQHKDNPVHWRPWGEAALAEAATSDRPILLSIGYAACHWCHVMARESFETPGIADLMNALFVPIKVDREERPDIDAIYQHALALMGQQGGWPLTMFLTPEGRPFWGGTYFPPDQRWGRPGFPDVLRGIAGVYRSDKTKVARNIEVMQQGLARLSQPASAGPVELALLDRMAERLASSFDPVNGGLGGAPKFPNCSVLEFMWRAALRTGDAAFQAPVLLTLDRMSQGGIYDHLGGGYARYSVDERWLAPHFEKMLYDNAQLLELLLWAWQGTGKALYRARIEETVTWLLREMLAEGNAFAATLDADSEHEEGKFYVWSKAEIDRLLGADAALFNAIYDVTPTGNWEEKTILNRLDHSDPADPATEALLERCRKVLFAARAPRIRPDRDDKVLADWNGLMIGALVGVATALDRPDWLQAAITAWQFVTGTMKSHGHRLVHSYRLGRTHPGTLDDHAAMARAGLALYQATGDAAYLQQAEAWVEVIERHYGDASGGYFLTADDTPGLITRTKSATDAAVPSGNGVLLQVLARLYALTAQPLYRDRAERLVAAFSGELDRNFVSLAAYLNGIDELASAPQVVIIGDRAEPATQTLLATIHGLALPGLVLQVVATDAVLPDSHPAHGKPAISGQATAYVCRGRTCSLPVTEPEALSRLLTAR